MNYISKGLTSKHATMMAPTMTKVQLRTTQRMRESDRPPTSVNFSMSAKGRRSRKNASLYGAWLQKNTNTAGYLSDLKTAVYVDDTSAIFRILSLTTRYLIPANSSTTMSMKQAMRPVRKPIRPQTTQRLISRQRKP